MSGSRVSHMQSPPSPMIVKTMTPTFHFGDSDVNAFYAVIALFTIGISSCLCKTNDNGYGSAANHALLKGLWLFSAPGLLLLSWYAEDTVPAYAQLLPQCAIIMVVLAWLVWKIIHFFHYTTNHLRAYIDDPLTAKRTIFWKSVAIHNGSYTAKVRKLHAEHGSLVQTGPYEYSLGDGSYFERCSRLPKVRWS